MAVPALLWWVPGGRRLCFHRQIESAQGYDLYVVKTAADGSLIWEKLSRAKVQAAAML